MRLRILEAYNEFKQQHMAPQCSPQQVRDMKIAFHAGAATCARLMLNLQSTDIIMQEDVSMIKDVLGELNKFTKDLREGNV